MKHLLCPIIAIAFLGLLATPALADRKDELQARFKERFARLESLRRSGAVGETWDGWVQKVKDRDLDAAAAKLVNEENADRRELYALLAAEESGATPELVAQRNAMRNYSRGKPGDWFKLKSGEWKQKGQ